MITLPFIHPKNHYKLEKRTILNPHGHWKMLLGAFSLLMAGLIILSLYLLFQIRNEQTFQVKPTSAEKPTLLKEDTLTAVMNSFEQKAKIEADIAQTHPAYRDPSL